MVFIKVLNPLALHLKNIVIMTVFEITNTEQASFSLLDVGYYIEKIFN